jgi:hypothetical protein
MRETRIATRPAEVRLFEEFTEIERRLKERQKSAGSGANCN